MHELKPLSETPLKPDLWPSSAVHSLITEQPGGSAREDHEIKQETLLIHSLFILFPTLFPYFMLEILKQIILSQFK